MGKLLTKPDAVAENARSAVREQLPIHVIVLITILAMAPLFTAEFGAWDDDHNITSNALLDPPTFYALGQFWTRPFLHLYIPLTYSAWWAFALIGNVAQPDTNGSALNPWIFHGANVLLHALAAVFAYEILRQLVKNRWAACAGALVFAIHPVQVEAVGWASGLKDVLAGLLSLVALWQYLSYAKSETQRWRLVIATVAFVAAMLAKPSAMVFPLIALWLDVWMIRRPLKRVAPVILSWLMLSAICAIVAKIVQPAPFTANLPLWARPLLATDSLAFYLYKIVWPANLCINYDRRGGEMITRSQIFVTWIVPVVIAIALAAWWRWRRDSARPFIAAAGVFVLGMLPLLNLVSFDFQDYSITADHYLYVSMFGVGLAAAAVLSDVIENRPRLRNPNGAARIAKPHAIPASVAAGVMAVIIIVALGVQTFRQSRTWHDAITLYTHTIDVNPRAGTSHANLASALLVEQRAAEAIPHAIKAIALRPRDSVGHTNLAYAYDLLGRRDQAIRELREAIRLEPDRPNAYSSLAAILASNGKLDDAIVLYQKALSLDPNFRAARIGLKNATEARKNEAPLPSTAPAPGALP